MKIAEREERGCCKTSLPVYPALLRTQAGTDFAASPAVSFAHITERL